MIYLILSILFSSSISFVMKYSENHNCNRFAVTVFNYLTGMIISYILLKDKTLFVATEEGIFTLALSSLNAVFFVSCLIFLQYSVRKNGAPMTATFNRLGIIIPITLSIFLFKEVPTPIQCVGLLLAVIAIIFINGGDKEQRGGSLLGLLMVFAIGGLVDLTSKMFSVYGNSIMQERYIFYTFCFSLLFSLIILIIKNRNVTKRDILAGMMVGIPNQLAALCLLKAVNILPAFLVFPLNGASVILVVNIVNFFVYKEKLSKRQYICTGLIGVALCFMNI